MSLAIINLINQLFLNVTKYIGNHTLVMCIFLCKEINSDISQSFVSFKIIFETYSSPEPPGNYSLPNFILEISIFHQPPGNFPGISPTPQKISSIGGVWILNGMAHLSGALVMFSTIPLKSEKHSLI